MKGYFWKKFPIKKVSDSISFSYSEEIPQNSVVWIYGIPSWKLTYPHLKGTFESMIFLFPRWDMDRFPAKCSFLLQLSLSEGSSWRFLQSSDIKFLEESGDGEPLYVDDIQFLCRSGRYRYVGIETEHSWLQLRYLWPKRSQNFWRFKRFDTLWLRKIWNKWPVSCSRDMMIAWNEIVFFIGLHQYGGF